MAYGSRNAQHFGEYQAYSRVIGKTSISAGLECNLAGNVCDAPATGGCRCHHLRSGRAGVGAAYRHADEAGRYQTRGGTFRHRAAEAGDLDTADISVLANG